MPLSARRRKRQTRRLLGGLTGFAILLMLPVIVTGYAVYYRAAHLPAAIHRTWNSVRGRMLPLLLLSLGEILRRTPEIPAI